MKKLIAVAAAVMCCAAFAEGPSDGAGAAPRPNGPNRVFRSAEGGLEDAARDPIMRVVMSPRAAEKLGLSEEQKEKLQELRKSAGNRRESQQKIRIATMRQAELMKAEKIDEDSVMKAIDELFEIRKEIAKDQTRRVIAVKSILTPEQIEKFYKELKEGSAVRGEHGGRPDRPEAGPKRGQRRNAGGPRRGDGRPGPRSHHGAQPDAQPEAQPGTAAE